ncbi:hypothetical protein [Mycolicibacterium llatzerense]|uniref:hypothetical protein n=1 Tax=Mycolicibacterium llatzerense TaxID=280871 RepID=UPI0021B5EAD2|nr:hypothetical protein [Mycolicibacterium llatzerense]MCT7372988.1 hypothetical protein [Mycolicibacterium llatzerense]
MTTTEPTANQPTLVGTVVIYRGRRYTVTADPELVDNAGVAPVRNSRGDTNYLFVAVDGTGQIVRAATRREPWATVTTTPPH